VTAAVPPGWPAQVQPPESPEFERTAVGWLLDLCPPDYRAYGVLRRYPVVLARFAGDHVRSAIAAARTGLAGLRADLGGLVPPEALEAAVSAYEREMVRLTATLRAVALVDEALRGRRFRTKL
jgi:hypothetical protein